jgi:hypothetical protein
VKLQRGLLVVEMEWRRRSTPEAELRCRCGCGSVWRGKEKFQCGYPRAAGAGGEGRHEEAMEMFTGDEELARSAIAR